MGAVILLLLFFVAFLAIEANPVYNVVDYGAIGDSVTDDTGAFFKAWATACADPSSPTFLIPSGKTFLVRQTAFQGPCNSSMNVQVDGDIVAPNKTWIYDGIITLIIFSGVNNLVIDGTGQFDGQGSIWWDCKNNDECKEVPYLFGIIQCNNVEISGLRFTNSPGKHVIVYQSTGVHIKGLRITAPSDSPNTDGIYTEESQQVEISDCNIGTGDDCIAVGNGTSGLNITNIICGPGHGISIGSLGKSNTRSEVQDVNVYQIYFINTTYGARIKTWQGGSGFAKRISFSHLNFDSVDLPISINQYYCGSSHSCSNSTSAVEVSDVTVMHAEGSTSSELGIDLACSETVPCTGIVLANITIVAPPSNATSYCLNAQGSMIDQVVPEVPCLS